jgi:hypothetical protein
VQCDTILPASVVDELRALLGIELIEETTTGDIVDSSDNEGNLQPVDCINSDSLICANVNASTAAVKQAKLAHSRQMALVSLYTRHHRVVLLLSSVPMLR